ncbi:MAG: hypothetical protein ACLTOT_01110 [Eubacterium callanderi]|uniref:hypothetical protein n=1 Tax=Eubacterium callanderi TaxID=53442 RepID=UPI0026735811|nr:hypothetical protein [Eubacterium callanderi]
MPKYIQQDQPYNCGAFSIAYLLWELEHNACPYDSPDDAIAYANKIHDQIKFGDSIHEFSYPFSGVMTADYCSPIKMADYLRKCGLKPTCRSAVYRAHPVCKHPRAKAPVQFYLRRPAKGPAARAVHHQHYKQHLRSDRLRYAPSLHAHKKAGTKGCLSLHSL